MKIKTKRAVLVLVLSCAAVGFGGCADYYAGSPGYGPYYGGPYNAGGPYGGGPYAGGPYYGRGYPGSVAVEIGDRPYYVHGSGYYVGRTYYVWKPGHWVTYHGQRTWRHGHYVVRGGY